MLAEAAKFSMTRVTWAWCLCLVLLLWGRSLHYLTCECGGISTLWSPPGGIDTTPAADG
ncbi:hypothetical protein PR003_g2539 [Phytophthora rubi]|uniref:Uncharacterized protein n=1 Tax=Phytophthora rubi TaxID=129364 RepID=A0A6A4G883_9STRA|nr:hypothetical protein PR002_g2370 [Phytophthora rubi]KAE9050522.1 hypothetical protein PR001_g2308 [Phytophthora rubi]KAE9356015.1 hypothetical protein PR003_g2539 [Phytophthora rubi]